MQKSSSTALEIRLPLLIGALLLATVSTITLGAYVRVRKATLGAANERLEGVAAQLSDLFQQSTSQLEARALAGARAQAGRGIALADTGTTRDPIAAVEIRDSAGQTIASAGAWSSSVASLPIRPLAPHADSIRVGSFSVLHDSIAYPLIARIPGTTRTVVYWRKLSGSRRARDQLSRLIGTQASLHFGSPQSGVWTDMERVVPTPQADPAHFLTVQHDVPRTPWRVTVQFPIAAVMAPVHAFLWELALITGVAILLGLAGTWWLSHTILRSLESNVEQRTKELNDALAELHIAQESLVRREKLAMLGQLAGSVGHELRNPLGVMTNAIYFLRMIMTSAPQKVVEYLDILQQQVTLSEKIVGDLLDFARLKKPQRYPASLADVTETQLNRLGSTDGVLVQQNIPASTPLVLVDAVQVGQVVFNLLTNALQAVDGAGRITIDARAENGHVRYRVTDTGPGIPAEHLSLIFEPLFTTKARGIGLGLAVSRTLAQANEGDLTVCSTTGKGAAFDLTLPIVMEKHN